jgi:hypothetical protein
VAASGRAADVTDSGVMSAPETRTLFFLGYEVRPAAGAGAEAEGIGGAFVRAWLLAPSLEDARQRAQQHLAASGWTILTVLKESPVRAEAGSEVDRAYLRQAQAEGEVFVIDAFPRDEAEGPADA